MGSVRIKERAKIMSRTVASYACLRAPNQPYLTSCKTHIDALRPFLEYLEFEDDINCTGLLGLRRLLSDSARCHDASCPHPLASPETFYWALGIFQDQLSVRCPSIGRGIALMLLAAMEVDDVELLERLISLSGDVNSKEIIKWFSPGHYLALKVGTRGLLKCTPTLIAHGINLHVLGDDEFRGNHTELCCNDSPTSLIMSYSNSFFLLRKLLRDEEIDIRKFVESEMEQGPLRGRGWTLESLLELFELDFEPFKMPLIRCHGRWQSAPELSWKTALERLKSRPEGFEDIETILQARHEDILSGRDIGGTICSFCSELALKST